MKYKGYEAAVEYDDEAEIFHGEVIDIKDVVTFQGTTVGALKQAFHDSVDDYLAFCAERGEEPDKPFSGQFLLRMRPDEHRELFIAAKKAGKSLNAWAVEHLVSLVRARQASKANVRGSAHSR